MKRNKICAAAAGLAILCGLLWPVQQAAAAGDDFGNIVHQIEAEYHVHRNYRFLMAFADQHLFADQPDTRLDEIVQAASKSGWHPLVRSYSRRTDEHSYIYVQGETKNLKLLIVSVEPDEAFVAQVKIDADKLSNFVNECTRKSRRW